MQYSESYDIRNLLGETVQVDLTKSPEFYRACSSPPTGLVKEIVNHPKAIRDTQFTENELQILTVEEMLVRRLSALDGISQAEAKEMAKEETLSMGELDALEIEQSRQTAKES